MGHDHDDDDHESDDERRNRQLVELLNELRVALPGVQMLFGFLLAVPFSARFTTISNGQRHLYYVTFLATAMASVCLIAPTSFHRIVWERHLKRKLIHISSTLALIGTGFLALAIACAVGLVTDLLFAAAWAAVAAAVAALILVWVWYALPLYYRIQAARLHG